MAGDFWGGFETMSAVSYRFHTWFHTPGFIPRFHTLVSYPGFIPWFHTLVSYLVSYSGFIPRVHTPVSYLGFILGFIPWFHTPVWRLGFIPWFHTWFHTSFFSRVWYHGFIHGSCWLHTGFIPGFIPVSYRFHTGFIPPRAIAMQCSCHSFVGCDDKETNSVVEAVVSYWLHTGFIPGFTPQQNRNQGFSKPGFSQEPEPWLWVHQTEKLFRRISYIIICKFDGCVYHSGMNYVLDSGRWGCGENNRTTKQFPESEKVYNIENNWNR